VLRTIGMTALISLTCNASAATCESRSADVVQHLDSAMAAFVEMDQAAFDTALDTARANLGCLIEPISAPTAAHFHRMVALESYLGGESANTEAAFFAALAIQPAYLLPTEIAPAGHPLQKHFEAARLDAQVAPVPVPLATGYTLSVDGYSRSGDPAGRMRIAQLIDPTGRVEWTHWLAPNATLPELGDAAPSLTEAPAAAPLPIPVIAPVPPPRSKAGMWAASGSTAVLSAIAYAVALNGRTQFDDPETPGTSLEGLYLRTNTSVVVSGALATASVGLAFSAALSGSF